MQQRATPRQGETTHAPSAIAWREKRFAPSKLVALLAVTSAAGLDANAVLAGTELDAEAVANPFTLKFVRVE